MENNSSFVKLVYLLALIATIIGFTAFSQKGSQNDQRKLLPHDTATSKSFRNDPAFGLDKLDIQLKQLDLRLDRLEEQFKNIDFSKAQRDINGALKELDMQKIRSEVDKSLKQIDWDRIDKKLDERLASIDKEKLNDVKRQLQKAKEDLKNRTSDLKFAVPEIDQKSVQRRAEKAMKNARRSIEDAKERLQNMRDFTNVLQNDGLIDKSKPYKIEVKDGELFLNGIKQTKEVSEKYNRYYKQKNFTIKMNEDDTIKI